MIARFSGVALAAALTILAGCDGGDTGPRVPAALRFVSVPKLTAAGSVLTPLPAVEVVDAKGARVTDYADSVRLALDSAGFAVALGGTLTVAAVHGVAHFGDLVITQTGAEYTLTASAPGLPSVTSTQFPVQGAAGYRLLFHTAPSYASAGVPFVIQPTIVVLDVYGNQSPVTATVTLTLLGGPGALHGTRLSTATLGLAPFAGLYVDSVGAGYRLIGTSPGLLPDTSNAFDVF